MMLARRIATALAAAYGGAWIGAAIVAVTSPSVGPAIAIFGVTTLLGFVVGFETGRRLKPWTAQEARDAVTGWGVVLTIIPVIACALLPSPWSFIAAGTILVLSVASVVALRAQLRDGAGRDPRAPHSA